MDFSEIFLLGTIFGILLLYSFQKWHIGYKKTRDKEHPLHSCAKCGVEHRNNWHRGD